MFIEICYEKGLKQFFDLFRESSKRALTEPEKSTERVVA
jgi:hypothetical protein